jgi:peptide/nickel transport system permease protein
VVFIALLGATGWFEVARVVRGEVQSLVRRDFILAAHSSGVSRVRILRRHLVPHLVPVLVISTTLNVAGTITLEAGLSFLGLGVQPPTPSWGNIMLGASGFIGAQWWLALFPALATVIAVVACHALGDALRDVFAMDQVPA